MTTLSTAGIDDNELELLCGFSRHTFSSEPYFLEAAYKHANLCDDLVKNATEQAVDIFPSEMNSTRRKLWKCNEKCRVNDEDVPRKYKRFLEFFSACTLKKVPMLDNLFGTSVDFSGHQ